MEKLPENPLALRDKLYSKFGSKWLEWLPEVLDSEMFGEGKTPVLSNMMQAIRISMTTDFPWTDWHIFENVGKSFNGQVPNFGILQPLSAGECVTTYRTLQDIAPTREFSEEVIIYIANCIFQNQLVYFPHLPIIKEKLDGLIYDPDLRDKVAQSWKRLQEAKSDKDLLSYDYRDTGVQVQLANLVIVDEYIKEFNSKGT